VVGAFGFCLFGLSALAILIPFFDVWLQHAPPYPPPLPTLLVHPLPITPVLFAEVIRHHFPRLVEMHNYSAASSIRQKL
jgi:hypothetical protein